MEKTERLVTIKVKAPPEISDEEVARLIDRLVTEGYNLAMDSKEEHDSGDYEDDDLALYESLDISDAETAK
jgi:hypothetical protein